MLVRLRSHGAYFDADFDFFFFLKIIIKKLEIWIA